MISVNGAIRTTMKHAGNKKLITILILAFHVSIFYADEAKKIEKVPDRRDLIANANCQLTRAGKAADALAKYLEEYGSITMSAPLFTLPGTNFAFELHRGTGTYFNEAKSDVNGAIGVSEQSATGFGLGIEAQYDPTLT